MKTKGFITLGMAAVLATFTACNNEETPSAVDQLELEMEAALDNAYESVDQAVEEGIAVVDASAGARMASPGNLGECAEVTHDADNKIITIDFGTEGCIGIRGNEFKGQIVIEYNDRAYVPGAYRIITFVDFYVNDVKVEGTRTITNTSADETERQFTVTLVGGKLDFGDGIFATRDAEWVRTWFIGEGIVTLSGGAEGVNINGVEYESNISTEDPITFSRACLVAVPVSGTKTMTVGEYEGSIDFGDGECDRLAVVTINGTSKTIDLRPRRARR